MTVAGSQFAYGYRSGGDDARKRIVRLDVVQHGEDWLFPIGSVMRATTTGSVLQLVRRKHRDGEQQTWWCRTGLVTPLAHPEAPTSDDATEG